MMTTAERNRFPFTASQWQELEHQALIFKYMVSGMPVPPDLLFTVKRSLDTSLSSKFILQQPPPHLAWNCFQMGFGRKIDPEPGRCRRTDGKKWRCSKEAYPDSKYCERHMHRGRNRSRKPVETMNSTTSSSPTGTSNNNKSPSQIQTHLLPPTAIPIPMARNSNNNNPNPSTTFTLSHSNSLSSLSPVTSESSHYYHHHHHTHPCYTNNPLIQHPFLSSSSRSTGNVGITSCQDNTSTTPQFMLESERYSRMDKDYSGCYHGVKEEADEHPFFSEPSSRTIRSHLSVDDSWQLTPLTMGSSSSMSHGHLKQQNKEDQHCYLLGSEVKREMAMKMETDEEPQKVMHHFFDDWPPKKNDSWLDSEKSSSFSSHSKTQLSISIPNSSHDFFRTHAGK